MAHSGSAISQYFVITAGTNSLNGEKAVDSHVARITFPTK